MAGDGHNALGRGHLEGGRRIQMKRSPLTLGSSASKQRSQSSGWQAITPIDAASISPSIINGSASETGQHDQPKGKWSLDEVAVVHAGAR